MALQPVALVGDHGDGQSHDGKGDFLPLSRLPFDVALLPVFQVVKIHDPSIKSLNGGKTDLLILFGRGDYDKIISSDMADEGIFIFLALDSLGNNFSRRQDHLIAPGISVPIVKSLEVAQIELAESQRVFFL